MAVVSSSISHPQTLTLTPTLAIPPTSAHPPTTRHSIISMFFLTQLIAVFVTLAFSSQVHARVTKVSVPDTALVGSTIDAVLYSEEYIQNWDDFGVRLCSLLLHLLLLHSDAGWML